MSWDVWGRALAAVGEDPVALPEVSHPHLFKGPLSQSYADGNRGQSDNFAGPNPKCVCKL